MFGQQYATRNEDEARIYEAAGRRLLSGTSLADIVNVPALEHKIRNLETDIRILQSEVRALQNALKTAERE